MDIDTQKLEQILSALKEKHKQIDNLLTLTKELEKVLETGDPESFGAVLSMRQGSMNATDKLNAEITGILAKADDHFRAKVLSLLEAKDEHIGFDDAIEKGIFETNRMTISLLQKIVKLDDEINKKVKGG